MPDSESFVPVAMLAARLQRASETDFFARLIESGHPELRMRHLLVLQALESGGVRPGTLAAALGVSQQSASELVEELERRGYVGRGADPADRRARLVTLTAKGEDAVGEGYSILTTMEEEYAAHIGSANYLAARNAMIRLIEELEKG
jgi:DNA-binding MarR family transcriptional regulator